MKLQTTPFLTAEWRHLAVLNFDVDPAVLGPFVPAGTELDLWQGTTLVSLVGFQFLDTARLWAGNSAASQLRGGKSAILRAASGGRRLAAGRGVHSRAGAAAGHCLDRAAAVRRELPHRADSTRRANSQRRPAALSPVDYRWRFRGCEGGVHLTATGTGSEAPGGSLEEFVIEHYWGYSGGGGRRTIEYRVDHPRWRLWPAACARFEGDVERLYGPEFVEALSAPPSSAFYADGSAVSVFRGVRIA